jgi:hypothetical protein
LSQNIKNIKEFYSNYSIKTVYLNNLSEAINIFYIQLFEIYSNNKFKFKNIDQNNDVKFATADLFGLENIYVTSKKIKIPEDKKKIIFLSYAEFKKLDESQIKINTYNHQLDLNYYIKSLNLENSLIENLKYYLSSYPFLLKSEIEKIFINRNYNEKLNKAVEISNNDIRSIRTRIFNLKKEGIDIKEFYKLTKKEAEIKKFNFLIY